MKRFSYILLIASMAAIAACQKQPVDNVPQESLEGSYIYTVKASISELEVKSDYDAEGKFSWSDGDAISVLFHKGDDNKFFTLTKTSGTGNTATFSGSIEEGYSVGASDGTGENMKIWALFPASANHTYTAGNNPKFFIPNEIDFTTSGFVANLPMLAVNTAEGDFSFQNIVCAYKFTVTNINASKAPKIKVVVSNQKNCALSGPIAIGGDGEYYLKLNDSDVSSGASKSISYVSNVTYDSDPEKGTAVFYVANRAYQKYFQPTIDIINYSTDFTIKTFTATAAPDGLSMGHVKQVTLDVSGGDYFIPAINIDGNYSDWSEIGGTSTISEICKLMKATSDKYYYYFYLVSDATKRALTEEYSLSSGYYYLDFDLDNDPSTGDRTEGSNGKFEAFTYLRLFSSDGKTITFADNPPYVSTSNGVSSSGVAFKGSVSDGLMHIEIKIPRANLPAVTSGQKIRVLSWRSKGGSNLEYTFEVA